MYLSRIRVFWLSSSRINSFEIGFFVKLKNVQRIHFINNKLTTIDFNEFAKNSKLEYLDVSKNQINEINSIKNSTVINITSLMIHDNDLTDISELCKLKKVKTLNLSGNRRLDYSKVTFSCWSELAHLYLAETNLKNINHDYRVLAGCNKLVDLDLSDNALGILCFEYFPALPKLANLNIRNNNLINLDVREMKRKFQGLLNVVIAGNKWSCNSYRGILELLAEYDIRYPRGILVQQ
jgi:Leucine-rich repeat (LRR) protein